MNGILFEYCGRDRNVNIPNCVTAIGCSAFSGCKNLVRVVIPDNVTAIGKNAFLGCKKLAGVTIPASVTAINSAFTYCDALTIHTPAGSYAETYAKEHYIPFVAE